MGGLDIVSLKNNCRRLRCQCHQTNKDDDWESFKKSKNELKSKIKFTEKSFYRKALSFRRPKNWATIHRILNPGKKGILFDPEALNIYYTTMTENPTGRKPTTKNEITKLINTLSSSSNQDQFYLQKVNYNQVLHEIKSLRSDCSTSAHTIPINLVKIVAEEIAWSLTEVINIYIEHPIFPSQWKMAKICTIPKIDIPLTIIQLTKLSTNFIVTNPLESFSTHHYETVMELHRRPCYIFKNPNGISQTSLYKYSVD